MAADECILTSDFLKNHPSLKVGDKVSLAANFGQLWRMASKVYN